MERRIKRGGLVVATRGLVRSQLLTVVWTRKAMEGGGMLGCLSNCGRAHHLLGWRGSLERMAGLEVQLGQILCKV